MQYWSTRPLENMKATECALQAYLPPSEAAGLAQGNGNSHGLLPLCFLPRGQSTRYLVMVVVVVIGECVYLHTVSGQYSSTDAASLGLHSHDLPGDITTHTVALAPHNSLSLLFSLSLPLFFSLFPFLPLPILYPSFLFSPLIFLTLLFLPPSLSLSPFSPLPPSSPSPSPCPLSLQLPLGILTAIPFFKGQLGNVIVWSSIVLGQPVAILMYMHDYYWTHWHALSQNGTAAS